MGYNNKNNASKSIEGYEYQHIQTAMYLLKLTPRERIVVEKEEDIEKIGPDIQTQIIQVKTSSKSVTFKTPIVLETLNNFLTNYRKKITPPQYILLFNSSIGVEKSSTVTGPILEQINKYKDLTKENKDILLSCTQNILTQSKYINNDNKLFLTDINALERFLSLVKFESKNGDYRQTYLELITQMLFFCDDVFSDEKFLNHKILTNLLLQEIKERIITDKEPCFTYKEIIKFLRQAIRSTTNYNSDNFNDFFNEKIQPLISTAINTKDFEIENYDDNFKLFDVFLDDSIVNRDAYLKNLNLQGHEHSLIYGESLSGKTILSKLIAKEKTHPNKIFSISTKGTVTDYLNAFIKALRKTYKFDKTLDLADMLNKIEVTVFVLDNLPQGNLSEEFNRNTLNTLLNSKHLFIINSETQCNSYQNKSLRRIKIKDFSIKETQELICKFSPPQKVNIKSLAKLLYVTCSGNPYLLSINIRSIKEKNWIINIQQIILKKEAISIQEFKDLYDEETREFIVTLDSFGLFPKTLENIESIYQKRERGINELLNELTGIALRKDTNQWLVTPQLMDISSKIKTPNEILKTREILTSKILQKKVLVEPEVLGAIATYEQSNKHIESAKLFLTSLLSLSKQNATSPNLMLFWVDRFLNYSSTSFASVY